MNRVTSLVLTVLVASFAVFLSGCCWGSHNHECGREYDGNRGGPGFQQIFGEVTLYQRGQEPVTWNEAPSEPHAFVVKSNLPDGLVVTSINVGTRRYITKLCVGDEQVVDPSCDGSYGDIEVTADISDSAGRYVGFARTMRYVEDSRWYGGGGIRYASRAIRRPAMWVINTFEYPRQGRPHSPDPGAPCPPS